MATLALLSGGIVVNVVEGNAVDFPGCEDISSLSGAARPSIGWARTGPMAYARPVAATTSVIAKVELLKRMTPAEYHLWARAAQVAADTNQSGTATPPVANRNALFALAQFNAMPEFVDMASANLQGLKNVWIGVGITSARADAILAPYTS